MSKITDKNYLKLRAKVQKNYPRYSDIEDYLKALKSLYPKNVRIEKIGRSIEGRPIYMVILQESQKQRKNGVMIESGIHAREWITHTTSLYIVETILRTQDLLKCMDFYIIPCINPDGYEYTHTKNRLWRKNMNKNKDTKNSSQNWGVDLNRNFPCGFGGTGSSSNYRSFNYKGKYKLSEPESKALAKAIIKYSHRIKLYISLHSHGYLIMYPWGHTLEEPSDISELHICAEKAQKSIKQKFPESRFKVGQISKILYIASGTSVDYVKKFHKIKFTYTIELRKGKHSGFILPPSAILSVAKETFTGIEDMVKYVAEYTKIAEATEKKVFFSSKRLLFACGVVLKTVFFIIALILAVPVL